MTRIVIWKKKCKKKGVDKNKKNRIIKDLKSPFMKGLESQDF